MKYQSDKKEKKTLSITGLLGVVRTVFAKIPNTIRGRKFCLSDCLMSALAMFSLKSPSLLAFDGKKATTVAANNLNPSSLNVVSNSESTSWALFKF